MRTTFKSLVFVLLALLPMAGCGSSSTNRSAADPLANHGQAPGSTDPTTTPSGPGTVLTYTMSLSTSDGTGSTTVGANSTVVATAVLKDNNGKAVALQPVKFEEVISGSDPASVTISMPIVSTSSEGKATTLLNTTSSDINRDVVIKASTSVNGEEISALSIFKMVRSTGNYIDFLSTATTTDPGGNMNTLNVTLSQVDPAATPLFDVMQLVTLQVLDRNAIPRTSVPVQLTIYNVMGGGCAVSLGSNGSQAQTVTTDNTGLDVFSSEITMPTPPVGSENTCSVVYKATTADPYATSPTDLFSYGAYIVTIKNLK